MNNISNDRKKQISDMVSVVKLSSLLFIGIILCKEFVENNNILVILNLKSYYTHIFLFIPLMIISFIYLLWSFSTKNKIKVNYGDMSSKIETIFFIIVFTVIIFFCGSNESQYKFLYLFIITTTTIQSGMKKGLIVSVISSIIILSMDIFMTPDLIVNTYFENDLILAGIFISTAWPLGFYVKVEGEHIEMLEDLVNSDALTKLYNHRYFYDALIEKVKIGERDNTPVSMIFIDIDYFKQYNDTFGHQKGDYVLKIIGELIKKNRRTEDIAARYGGEEFALLLPDTSEKEALSIAENLRSEIELTYFEGEETQPKGKITVSMGVTVFPDKAKNEIELIKSADDALYRAKFFDKNRVEAYKSILDKIKNNIDEKDIESLEEVIPLIISHHERYDGNGYPNKQKGEEIPYLARILTVVDSFDAMTSNRPYNIIKTYEEAVEELIRCSGTQFDPDIAKAFAEVVTKNNGLSFIENINKNS